MIAAALLLALPALPALAQSKVILVGDSVTVGTGATDLTEGGTSYARLIETALGDFAFTNLGDAGSTAWKWDDSEWAASADSELPVRVCVLELGIVDALQTTTPLTTQALYKQYIREMVDLCAGIVLLVTPYKPDLYTAANNAFVTLYYDAALEIIAEDARVYLGADAYTNIVTGDFAGDDLHPNDQGHDKIADELIISIPAAMTNRKFACCPNLYNSDLSGFLDCGCSVRTCREVCP